MLQRRHATDHQLVEDIADELANPLTRVDDLHNHRHVLDERPVAALSNLAVIADAEYPLKTRRARQSLAPRPLHDALIRRRVRRTIGALKINPQQNLFGIAAHLESPPRKIDPD